MVNFQNFLILATKISSITKYFRYQFRYFFPVTNFSDTGSNTFLWYQIFLILFLIIFHIISFFRYLFRYHQRNQTLLQWFQRHKVFEHSAWTLVVLILFRLQTRKEATTSIFINLQHKHNTAHTHLTTQWHTHIRHTQACIGHARRQTQKPLEPPLSEKRWLSVCAFYSFRELLLFIISENP